MFVLAILIFVCSLCESNGLGTTNCNDYKECAGKSIDDEFVHCNGLSGCSEASINTITPNGYIHCNGQTSCYNTISLTSKGNVLCQGYKSCRYAKSIIAHGNIECNAWSSCDHDKNIKDYKFNSYSDIKCSGSSSCQYNIMESDENTLCDGDRSCYRSIINSGNDIYCDADKSCAKSELMATNTVYCSSKGGCYGAEITANTLNLYGMYSGHESVISAHTINGFGHYSMSYSTIDSVDIDKMEINVYGDMSGFGANIICRAGSQCIVDCKGSGCNGMLFVCLNGAKCNISPSLCSSDNSGLNIDGIDCPIWKDNVSMDHNHNILMGYLKQNKMDRDEILKELEIDGIDEAIIVMDDDTIDGLLDDNINRNIYGMSAYAVQRNRVKTMISNSMIYSNLLCGLIVCLLTILMVHCYFRAKYQDNK